MMVPSALQTGARPPRGQSRRDSRPQVVQPKLRRFVVALPRGDNHMATIRRKPRILQGALRLPDHAPGAVRAWPGNAYAGRAFRFKFAQCLEQGRAILA